MKNLISRKTNFEKKITNLKNEVNLSKNMSKSGALLFESSSDLTCKILSSAIEKKKIIIQGNSTQSSILVTGPSF